LKSSNKAQSLSETAAADRQALAHASEQQASAPKARSLEGRVAADTGAEVIYTKGTSLEALGKENGLLRHVGVGPSLSAINSKIWDEIVDSSEWQ
jgi:hypothetical protein